jgi:YesN/AraC family two-component response regulator
MNSFLFSHDNACPGNELVQKEVFVSDAATILVADDEEMIRRTVRILLTAAGFEVQEAASGFEALEKIAEEKPSLIISDINMPGNDDLQFIKTVSEKYPGLPVILLTAFPTVDTAVASVNLSVAAYLVKPLDAEKVLTVVRSAIGNFEAREAVKRSLSRLGDWRGDLERLESLMDNVRVSNDANTSGAFMELTVRHMLTSLVDLREVVSVLASAPSGSQSVRSLELAKAVEETIGVLEKTKRVFKSKDLGELRHKLEAVLAAASSVQ